MEKSREQRFQTAEEFVAALDQVTASSVTDEALGTAIPKPRIQAVPTPSTAGVAVPVSTTGCAPTAAHPESRSAIVQSAEARDPAVVNSVAQHVFLRNETPLLTSDSVVSIGTVGTTISRLRT
jgi:hypothetical protein